MNLRDFVYLTALKEYRHFGQAAANCFVSQPTLSMQLKKLEQELGVLLIERQGKFVRLTVAGELIAARAQLIIAEAKNIKQLAKQAQNPLAGEMHLGIIPTLAPYLLPRVIPLLKKALPLLKIYLVEEKTEHLMTQLTAGKIDTALLALPFHQSTLTFQSLFHEEFLLAVPKNHALAKRKAVTIADIEKETLLLLTEGHCLRDQSLQFCERVTDFAVINVEATSLETLRQMVILEMGMTFMPKLACRADKQIQYLPFKNNKPAREIAMVYRQGWTREKLLAVLQQQFRQSLSR